MTTETSADTRPISEATYKKVRVVRIGTNRCAVRYIAFIENVKSGGTPERMTRKHLLSRIGRDIPDPAAIVSCAENRKLSEAATALFFILRTCNDEARSLKIIADFVANAEHLAVMPSDPI